MLSRPGFTSSFSHQPIKRLLFLPTPAAALPAASQGAAEATLLPENQCCPYVRPTCFFAVLRDKTVLLDGHTGEVIAKRVFRSPNRPPFPTLRA